MASATRAVGVPPRRTLLDLAFAAYFVALVAAPLAVTPALSASPGLSYDVALRNVGVAVALGYAAGLALLLWLQ